MKSITKLYLACVSITLLFLGCQNDDGLLETEMAETQKLTVEGATVYQEQISASQAPELIKFVSEKIGGEKAGLALKTNNLEGLEEYKINWEEVNIIIDSTGIKNYALRLETKNANPLIFYNIVVTENTKGKLVNPKIAEYVVDKDFYLEWRKDPEKLKEFTGEVYYYDMEGNNFGKIGKTATLNARTPGQAPCPSITFGPSGPSAPSIPNIYCWTYVSYGLCETQITYDTGSSYHGSNSCGAGTGSPIYGYGVTCNTGGGPTPPRNTSKGSPTGKSPCGGGGGSVPPGGVPINPVNPGAADIGSFIGFLDNKLQLTTAQENFLEKKPEAELILELSLLLKMENYSSESKDFARKAINAVMKGGNADVENRLIFDKGIADQLLKAMSPKERSIYDKELSTTQKSLYLSSAVNAYIYAETFYPQPVRNRIGDAIKHSMWNALSASRIGESLTKKLTDAHEDITYDKAYANHYKETQMDLFNNNVGRNIGKSKPSGIFILIEAAKITGRLRYLDNLAYKNGFYNATNSSKLIPTN